MICGTVLVNKAHTHQTIRDFGASACWWAPGMGTEPCVDQLLDLLFSEKGLGLNVLRFNAGGSVKSDRSDARTDKPAWRAPLSALKEDGTYDIRRDIGTWTVVQKAARLGTITDFTLFMNSPPSTMTVNGLTSAERPAAEDQYVSNLRPDCYEQYARYVADVTEMYVMSGIPVKYVSPINEPQWQWDDRNRQEGCHYSPEECVRIFRLVIQSLREKAMQNPAMSRVRISMPETAQWWQHTYVHDMYRLMCQDPEISPWIDHFSAHSYGTTAEQKKTTREYFDSLGISIPLHQTEWAPLHDKNTDGMDFALELANVLYEDMTILHTEHWTWWLGVTASPTWPDGLIRIDPKTMEIALPKRYFAMKHHSRFIRDHVQIDASEDALPECVRVSAYLSEDGAETVLILVNSGQEPCRVRLEGVPEGIQPECYETSVKHDCQYLGRVNSADGYCLPPRSITNLVFCAERRVAQ